MNSSTRKWIALGALAVLGIGSWMMWQARSFHSAHRPSDMIENTVLNSNPNPVSPTQPSQPNPVQAVQNTQPSQSTGTTLSDTAKSSNTPTSHPQNSEKPAANQASCFVVSYRHKSIPSHGSDDECSHHRNLIKLTRADINPKSICIRVNNVAVQHEMVSGKSDELIIGAVAGPKDVITARFCVGKSKCNESCDYAAKALVKRDEFLDAIGGSDDDEENLTQLGQWEANDASKGTEINQALDGEIRKELEGEHSLIAKKPSNSKLEIFKDWTSEAEKSACTTGRVLAEAERQ